MLLEVNHLQKSYPSQKKASGLFKRQKQKIIDDVSFTIMMGESVGLVGESGSGKSTLARLISGIEVADKGNVQLNGEDIHERKNRRDQISIVFQDYTTSVNPTMNVLQIIAEPLQLAGYLSKSQQHERVATLLEYVGLSPDLMNRYIYELSGGQAQRVCIGRALATHPSLIILDEAISSLDIPTQVQLLDLLENLKAQLGLSYLFITHDIQAVCYFCQRILFFQHGKIVEICETNLLADIQHPYAKQLINAVI